MIIDNSIVSFGYHLDNGIPICSWFDNWKDQEVGFLVGIECSYTTRLASCTLYKQCKTFVPILLICLDSVKPSIASFVNELNE